MRQLKSFFGDSFKEDRRVFENLFGFLRAWAGGYPSIWTSSPPLSEDPLSLGQAAEKDGDIVGAERLYNLAVEGGSARALYHIGNLFASGLGRTRDLEEAERWYKLAAQKGDAYALHDLAMWNYFGVERPVNIEEAARLYQMSAEQGFGPAQDALIGLYEAHPEVAAVDEAAVLARCQKAAQEGSATAMLQLARVYRRGQWGIDRSAPEALRLYELAGANGLAVAYFELGTMFESGDGVPQNYSKAQQYYERATQGTYPSPDYQFHLAGLMEKMGNNPEAHAWYNLASANELATVEQRRQYTEAREALARIMTPDQVAEAHLLAERKFENPCALLSNPTPEVRSDGRRLPAARLSRPSRTSSFLTGVLVGSMIADEATAAPSTSSDDTGSSDAAEADFEAGGGDFGGGGASGDYGGDFGGD